MVIDLRKRLKKSWKFPVGKVQPYISVFKFNRIWGLFSFFFPFVTIFLRFWAFFVARVRFIHIFRTYLGRQSALLLEVHIYLFVFGSAKFRAIYQHFLAPLRLFWGLGSGSKPFWDLLKLTKKFYFGGLALSCFFESFLGGVEVVGYCDFKIL